jgi:DNA-binding GntR family transcriptional regulator
METCLSQPSFLYRQTADEIRERIENGVYKPGSRLPSIDELVKDFSASTITIRRAISELVREGRLIPQQGRGNFVADRRPISRRIGPDFGRLPDFAGEIRRAGMVPGTRLMGLLLERPDRRVADMLQLPRDKMVYRMESVVLADGAPLARDRCYFSQEFGDRIRDRLRDEYVIAILKQDGVAVDHVDLHIEATPATETEREALGVQIGAPLLTIGYTPFSPTGAPLLTGRFTSPGNRLSYDICAKPELREQSSSPKPRSKKNRNARKAKTNK